MSKIEVDVDSLRCRLSYDHDDILTIIEQFNGISELNIMPLEVRYDLGIEAIKCSSILIKYSQCLQIEDDTEFCKCAFELLPSIEEEMALVHDFQDELNNCLMDYGEGPLFSENNVPYTQPEMEL